MIVKFFMCLHTQDIVAIQQPVQLLTGQANDLIQCLARPFELGLLQTLLPHTKTIAFPIQHFDLVALAIAEHKQMFRERIQFQCGFDQYA